LFPSVHLRPDVEDRTPDSLASSEPGSAEADHSPLKEDTQRSSPPD
jgi:hypothetical protein